MDGMTVFAFLFYGFIFYKIIGVIIEKRLEKVFRKDYDEKLIKEREQIYQYIEAKMEVKYSNNFAEQKRLADESIEKERKLIEQERRLKDDNTKMLDKFYIYLDALNNFEKGFLDGRKWLANFFAEANTKYLETLEDDFRKKKNPAIKAAEQIKEERKKRKEAEFKLKLLEAEIATIHEYFPFTLEFRDEILNDNFDEYDYKENTDIDPVSYYLTKEEYNTLTPTERNQRALTNYINRNHNKWGIGQFYERYIGYVYEKTGFMVEYRGIVLGKKDEGIDLVCRNGNKFVLLQLKCWSKEKRIHEKHIFQMYATSLIWKLDNIPASAPPDKYEVSVGLMTTTFLSERAKQVAQILNIQYREDIALNKNFPLVKLNTSKNGELIYHLPMDQQYDKIKKEIGNGYDRVASVYEAEKRGYRRAFRHRVS